MADSARTPAQGRGAYRDRHERGPGGGGRGSHRRDRHRRAGNRERQHRAHDRCDRRTAKSCRPGARGLCAKSCGDGCGPTGPCASAIRKATGAIVHRSPGRARHKPFQPSAQGRPGCSGCPVSPLCIVAQSAFGMAADGSQPAPGLPCALFHLRAGDEAKLGRNAPRG